MSNRFTREKRLICIIVFLVTAVVTIQAQDNNISRTPLEQRELFGYCEKPELIKQLKFSPEMADRVGEIDYWLQLQLLKFADNTNDTFATPKEVQDEVIKKYKAMHLSSDQIKALLDFKKERQANPPPCAVITLSYNAIFDTMATARALLLYKTPFRKSLIEKAAVNGRQADQLFEIEVWKQKEAAAIAKISPTDFNRIRKTVAMYTERERRIRTIGLSEEQVNAAILFFNEHAIGVK